MEAEAGVKEIRRGIILPPRAVTRMMALRVPLGPATRTRPVGKDLMEVFEEDVPDSGEEGGVRVGGAGTAPAPSPATFTVSWVEDRAAAGETSRLLFSSLTVGEKGGVSPSREWMEEVEEEEERRPGEEYESSVLLPRPRSQRFSSSRLSLSSSVSS